MSQIVNPTATAVTFQFGNYYQTSGHDRYDLFQRVDMLAANGLLLVCNGMDPNTKVDPDNGITDLLLRAPRDEIVPAVTIAPSPTGKVFGNGLKWRIRYRNSKTGECSGLSPIPSVGMNMGVTTTGTSFMGQTAYFIIAGVATTYGADAIDLFRNTSEQDSVWYLIDSASNPGAASTVKFTDNNPDEDIWNNEVADLHVNPSYYTPHPPPCARIFQHNSGRVFLYGHINMGTYTAGVATIDAGGNVVTGTISKWYRGREGQKIRWTTDSKRTEFRIVEVTDLTTMYVTPASPVALGGAYEIIDDIDARDIHMMDPTSPAQHDPLDVLTVGQDRSDGVMGLFAIGSTTFVLTRFHLWALQDDETTSPRETTRAVEIAKVGCVGLWAWCMTPFGVVFLDETQGVMLFDGQGIPRPLGSDSPLIDFMPKTQFDDMDRGLLSDAYIGWDSERRRVFLTYCPSGVSDQTEQLVYDPKTNAWRGPWRRPVFTGGRLINATGDDIYLLGDQNGSLYLESDIAQDQINPTVSGTCLSQDNPVQIQSSAAVFTSAMVGAPILFNDGAGNYYLNWIARFMTTTKVILRLVPTVTVATMTFRIGAIHWQAKTAFVDLGDPGSPKQLTEVMVGYDRISNGVDAFVVQGSSEGITLTESADATVPETGGKAKATAPLNLGGTTFTLRFSGRASYGNPQITKIRCNMVLGGGNQDPVDGDQKKTTINPTITS